MREVRWRDFADAQYQEAIRRFPRLREAVDGSLRAISLAGLQQQLVPDTGGRLHFVETRKSSTVPATALYFVFEPNEDCYWVEELRVFADPVA